MVAPEVDCSAGGGLGGAGADGAVAAVSSSVAAVVAAPSGTADAATCSAGTTPVAGSTVLLLTSTGSIFILPDPCGVDVTLLACDVVLYLGGGGGVPAGLAAMGVGNPPMLSRNARHARVCGDTMCELAPHPGTWPLALPGSAC